MEHVVRFMDHMERILRVPEKSMRGLSISSRVREERHLKESPISGSRVGETEDMEERITRKIQLSAEERILGMEERLGKNLKERLVQKLEKRLGQKLEKRQRRAPS